jgi:hypothetical protein
MAYTYGTVTNCKVRNGQTRDEYECRLGYEVQSQSIANNTSSVKLRLECRSISSSYTTKGSSGLTSKIDGTTVKNNAAVDMSNTNTWQNFGERTITVTHNANGTYSASKTGSFTCTAGSSNYSLASGSASVTVKPKDIPRYATSNQSLKSKTSSSITMNWSSDSTIDYIWYSSNNGSSWTGVDVTDGTSGSYTITGLAANTTYNIKTRVRRKDSQLTTDSSSLSVTTHAKTVPTISLSSKTVNSITVTSGCNVTVSSTQYRIKTSSGSYGSYQSSATFSGLSPNTTYVVEVKKVGQASGESGTTTLTVTTYQIATIDTANFNLGDSFNIKITNPSGQSIEFFAETLINGQRENTIRVTSISAGTHTITFSDGELDMIYKKMGTGNSALIRIGVRTVGTYYDWKDVTCTLTGNQKTTHIGVNGSKKRAKVYLGVNGSVKRVVVWIGNNGRKRCI